MGSLGFLGIVVDGTNLKGVKHYLTRSAGVHDWPIAVFYDSFLLYSKAA